VLPDSLKASGSCCHLVAVKQVITRLDNTGLLAEEQPAAGVPTAEGTFCTMVMQPSGMTLLLVMMGAAAAIPGSTGSTGRQLGMAAGQRAT
jgi:hypothetical protein